MEGYIPISYLNDFIFCPASIYFHQLYGDTETLLYQNNKQIDGKHAHSAIDDKRYSTKKDILQGIFVYSSKYNICGKIDTFDSKKGILTERKKHISIIYDGYVFQLYAQYFGLVELGYNVHKIRLYDFNKNKVHDIKLPKDDTVMLNKFDSLVLEINNFDITGFKQTNLSKCTNCIYEPACDRSLL